MGRFIINGDDVYDVERDEHINKREWMSEQANYYASLDYGSSQYEADLDYMNEGEE